MIRVNWKVSVLLVFLTATFSTFILPSMSFAHETPRISHYVPCSRIIKVTEVTLQDNSYTGVKLTGQIIAEMDSQDATKYCGTLIVAAIVTTTHGGVLNADFAPPNVHPLPCRVNSNCQILGKNTFGLYNVQYITGGINQCADVRFKDDNGNTPAVYPCWSTPSVKRQP